MTRPRTHEEAPVVIAGAGPAGCCAALYLARAGIPVLLLESEPRLPKDLRASTLHPPTLDLLDTLGLTDELIAQGLIVREFQFRERSTNTAAKFNLIHLKDQTNHPYRLQCEQYKLTEAIVRILADYPHAEVRFEHSVVGFRDRADGVDVLAFYGDSERKYFGSFLIACDGANSRIRQASGTAFPGLTYPERFLTVSTEYPFENDFDELSWVNYISDPDEWCVMLKTPQLWRVQFPTPIDLDEDELLSDDFIQLRLKKLNPKGSPYSLVHKTLYRVHQRVAETYRVGPRTVLAGDAAHVNNPLGGMGMNGGLHDVFNLCGRLVAILHEGASIDTELDLYDAQRRGICIDFIQNQTIENKKLMEANEETVQLARQRKFLDIAGSADLQREYLMRSSMITCLRDSYEIEAA